MTYLQSLTTVGGGLSGTGDQDGDVIAFDELVLTGTSTITNVVGSTTYDLSASVIGSDRVGVAMFHSVVGFAYASKLMSSSIWGPFTVIPTVTGGDHVTAGTMVVLDVGVPAIAFGYRASGSASMQKVMYVSARDAAASSWNTPVEFIFDGYVTSVDATVLTLSGNPIVAYGDERGAVGYMRALDQTGTSWTTLNWLPTNFGQSPLSLSLS